MKLRIRIRRSWQWVKTNALPYPLTLPDAWIVCSLVRWVPSASWLVYRPAARRKKRGDFPKSRRRRRRRQQQCHGYGKYSIFDSRFIPTPFSCHVEPISVETSIDNRGFKTSSALFDVGSCRIKLIMWQREIQQPCPLYPLKENSDQLFRTSERKRGEA